MDTVIDYENELINKLNNLELGYVKIKNPDILKQVHDLYINGYDSKNTDSMYLFYLGSYEKNINKNYDLAEKYYLKSIEQGNHEAMNNLAIMYKKQEKYDLAEKYYLMSIEKGNDKAMNNLAFMYKEQKKYDLAEKYYLMSIEKGIHE